MTDNREVLRSLRHLIVDLDGVMYRGREPIPGAGRFIRFLREHRIGFVLATNNSTRTPRQYVERLAEMGIDVSEAEILTSAQAAAGYLGKMAPAGARVFMIGMDGLRAALEQGGHTLVDDEADWVVVGMDFTICFERLAAATLQIRAGARFLGTNPDRTFPTERGIIPGAGSLLALLETATGVSPTVVGKPETTMLEQAMARLGATPGTTAIVGDRLETDILAGRRAGMRTVLVLSGIADKGQLAASDVKPDLVFRDVGHLAAAWQATLDA